MTKYTNLNVPFSVPVPGGMTPGTSIVVQGKVPSMSQRFAVNLTTHSGDIALHVCPRFRENRVVRNSTLNMNWGPEESHGSMPIHPGQNFEILILCQAYDFKIAFNGVHFCEFSHRLPVNTIATFAVDGDVSVHNLVFQDPTSFKKDHGTSNSASYGFRPGQTSNHNSGGLYPTIDPSQFPTDPSPRRSPSPSAPYYSGGNYPSAGGGGYPSPYPTQPGGYPSIPHQGPYPQVPNSGGVNPTPHSKPGFLDQAGAALAGVIGPGLLAGGMNKNSEYGKPNLLDEAGKALAGIIGGAGQVGAGQNEKGTRPQSSTQHSGLMDAGTALAGLLAAGGLAAASRSHSGGTSQRQTQPGSILDQAGSALAGILSSGSLAGAERSVPGRTPTAQSGSILDQAGSALAGILAGGGLTGADRSLGGGRAYPARPAQSGSILDQVAGILGGGGLTDTGHHKHKKYGVLGGALGTAVAGAALTGHLNPIKATKKQLKAQKKALKYGLPIAGAGLGAYALHKGLKKGFRRSSSSSSSSSSD